jgi:hypothetical protein
VKRSEENLVLVEYRTVLRGRYNRSTCNLRCYPVLGHAVDPNQKRLRVGGFVTHVVLDLPRAKAALPSKAMSLCSRAAASLVYVMQRSTSQGLK